MQPTSKNIWRPITLLSCDFNKYAYLQVYSVYSLIIHGDQTCGIPGRHIYDCIALSCNIIDNAKCDDIPM